MLARRTLVASNVRRVVDAAGGKPVLFFADRFDHWATQGGDGYAAFVGGAQGVATDAQAAWWGERGLGTIPHALIATFGGDTVAAVAAFARQFPGVPLIALVDFDNDSVATSLACAKEFGERLWGVRLDTSGTMVDRSLWSEMGEFAPTGSTAPVEKSARPWPPRVRPRPVIVSGGFTRADRRLEATGVRSTPTRRSSLLRGADTRRVVRREGRPCAKVGRAPPVGRLHRSTYLPQGRRARYKTPACPCSPPHPPPLRESPWPPPAAVPRPNGAARPPELDLLAPGWGRRR